MTPLERLTYVAKLALQAESLMLRIAGYHYANNTPEVTSAHDLAVLLSQQLNSIASKLRKEV